MAGMFKWKVTGPAGTVERLKTFKKALRSKTLRKAGQEGSKVILPEMKSATPKSKKDWGPGGSLRRSMGRKVSVKRDRMWFGVGPRTKWMRAVAKANRFWRDKSGRIRKAPLKGFKSPATREWGPGGTRFERPSRRAHLSEKKTNFMRRVSVQMRGRAEMAMARVLEQAVQEV